MARPKKPMSSRDKVRAYRQRMRAMGMKPITIWVPDVESPVFKAEARRQSRLVAQSPGEKEDLAFLESLLQESGYLDEEE